MVLGVAAAAAEREAAETDGEVSRKVAGDDEQLPLLWVDICGRNNEKREPVASRGPEGAVGKGRAIVERQTFTVCS